MMAPASQQIAGDFGVTDSAIIALFTSVFVAAYGEYMRHGLRDSRFKLTPVNS